MLLLTGLTFLQDGFSQELNRYDIIIHEIYADPTPTHGLPQSEYIEIRNLSTKEIDLKNFTISNGTNVGKINYSTLLKPDSLLILCSSSSMNAFSVYGRTQVVSSFPALSNEKDTISIIAPNGLTLHAVNYDLSWYHDDFKQEGGWSLEMISPDKACMGMENWSASIDPLGGTPGKPNSLAVSNINFPSLKLSYAYLQDSLNLKMVFNHALAPISDKMNLNMEDHSIDNLSLEPPLYNIISAGLTSPVKKSDKLYALNLTSVSDCIGNQFDISTQVGLFSALEKTETIINEILFNPENGGSDYVELMNQSTNTYDLSNIHLANRNSAGKISSISKITDEHLPLFPNSFVVFSEDCFWLLKKYQTDSSCNCIQMQQMPSLPDESGNVLILNESGMIIDDLIYDENWHNKLVYNNEGVALERIAPNRMTNDPLNWYSASSQSGYGTPGKRNSQNKTDELSENLIVLSNPIVSPDNDGRDDFVLIKYHLPLNGYIANISVTDRKGQIIKRISKNELCGITGQFRWDGLDEKGNKVIPGIYIIATELFHLSGSVKRIYKSVGVYY